nr:hypothetical protein [Nitrospirales bacterium]
MAQRFLHGLPPVHLIGPLARGRSWASSLGGFILGLVWMVAVVPLAISSHKGSEEHHVGSDTGTENFLGHIIEGAPFQVYLSKGAGTDEDGSQLQAKGDAA